MDLKIDLDGNVVTVSKEKYVAAKTKDLVEYGYATLTEEEVSKQVDNVLSGAELSIIGMFIEKDIVKD